MNQNLTDQCGAGKNSEILARYKKFREANCKSKNTIKGDLVTLNTLIKFTKNKPLNEINESDLQGYMKTIRALGTKTLYGMKLINFFKWLKNEEIKKKNEKIEDEKKKIPLLPKRARPDVMAWFEFPSEELKAKHRDPDVKRFLITPTEYNKIIQYCRAKPKWSALYETLYLSGGRPDEVNSMNVGDVIIEGGKVTVTLKKSKTIPRKVPLADTPKMLIRWIQNHPFKDNPYAPLFPSYSTPK